MSDRVVDRLRYMLPGGLAQLQLDSQPTNAKKETKV